MRLELGGAEHGQEHRDDEDDAGGGARGERDKTGPRTETAKAPAQPKERRAKEETAVDVASRWQRPTLGDER